MALQRDASILPQSSFSRSLANEAKMGAYFTEVGHCERLGDLFSFPQEEEVCVLEPSIGNGEAVAAITKNCPRRKIFGVELNTETYEQIKSDERFLTLNADFLKGVKISNKAFSFVFANPPYGMDQDEKDRLEKLFMDKLFSYLTPMGILVYVIPHSVLVDEKFVKPFFARYNPLVTFKFDDDEFAKYKQVAIIAQRRNSIGYMSAWLEKWLPTIARLEDIPYLPQLGTYAGTKIPVPPSADKDVQYFTTLKFDADEAIGMLNRSSLYRVIEEQGMVPSYQATELGQPPVPLKKDLLYLCAISGGGQGLTGSEESGDLHLQRGVAKVVKEHRVESEADDAKLVESSFTKIILSVIENDGTITVLE